jgi:hypothetical protein
LKKQEINVASTNQTRKSILDVNGHQFRGTLKSPPNTPRNILERLLKPFRGVQLFLGTWIDTLDNTDPNPLDPTRILAIPKFSARQ